MITLTQIAAFRDTDTLEKARHGRYADTAKNRRLHRVGQEYGKAAQEDPESEKKPQAQQETEQPKKERNGDSVKRELELLEEHKDSIVEKYGEKAYNKKVESLKKEGEDFEQKETVKELKERADKEDADKVMKEEEEKEQKDKALQEAIGKYKEKQEYLKKEVQAIKDMAKKLKRKVGSDEMEDILEYFDEWMEDYGSELKIDIEKDVKKNNLTLEEVEEYLDELEEYALSYYEQDVKGVKEELEGLMNEYFPKEDEEFTFEEMPDADKMSKKEYRAYLKTPEGKKRKRLAEAFEDKAIRERVKKLIEIRDRFRDYYPEIKLNDEDVGGDGSSRYTLIFPSNDDSKIFAGEVKFRSSNDTPLNKENKNIYISQYANLSKEGKELLEKVSNDENFFRRLVEIGMDAHNFHENSRIKLKEELRTKFPDVVKLSGYIREKGE